MPNWKTLKQPLHENVPFRMSLDSADRHMLVRQSAETWVGKNGPTQRKAVLAIDFAPVITTSWRCVERTGAPA